LKCYGRRIRVEPGKPGTATRMLPPGWVTKTAAF
jgi:hypothetical protein